MRGWDDYDRSLISEGGGVFDRSAKSIPLSPQVKKMLGVLQDELPTDAVIRLILRMQVDLLCNQLIARRQPIAVDLREVMAAIHAVNDLERIGDEAKKIAYKSRHLDAYSRRDSLPLEKVQTMASLVIGMLEQALDAFLRHDARTSHDLAERDRAVDRLRNELNDELVARMSADPASITAAMDLVFAVQSLERIGDHAKNIAEYVVNVVEGIDTRHAGVAGFDALAGS